MLPVDGLAADLEALAGYSEPGPGVTRLAWSAAHHEACEWLVERMSDAGLEAGIDQAGNVLGRVGPPGTEAGAVVVGSHIDTVPEGGAFDGALGVMAGLGIARQITPRVDEMLHPFWLIAFMDEEGVRFDSSYFGSRAFVGEPLLELDRTDRAGTSLRAAMGQWEKDPADLSRAQAIGEVSAYLELHIEQGPQLEASGVPIGIVTQIMGRRIYSIEVRGAANHAGTTPRADRRDALRGAAWLIDRGHEAFDSMPSARFNVGAIEAHPNATNVIPGRVELSVEVRAASVGELSDAEDTLRGLVAELAASTDLECGIEVVDAAPPVDFDQGLVELLERAAADLGLDSTRLASGAGHDAAVIARHVPAAMVMVPSRGGTSHSPDEFTEISACLSGAQVLAVAAEKLTVGPQPEVS